MGDIQQDPSMEEILASIKRVIREDNRAPAPPRTAKRQAQPPAPVAEEDVLELDQPMEQPAALASEDAVAASRQSLAALSQARAPAAPPVSENGPLEAAVRDMLRPMLKEWLDEHLPQIVEELVTREISRISGR
jgi:cell pole-organizing protein PopZ